MTISVFRGGVSFINGKAHAIVMKLKVKSFPLNFHNARTHT